MPKLRATREVRVAGATRYAGDEFEVTGKEARLLVALGKAEEVPDEAPAQPPAPAPAPSPEPDTEGGETATAQPQRAADGTRRRRRAMEPAFQPEGQAAPVMTSDSALVPDPAADTEDARWGSGGGPETTGA